MRCTLRAYLFTLTVLSAACTSKPPEAAAPVTSTAPVAEQDGGIAWRKGDIDAAFAEAKASNKPVFLYWGAVWCPPCQQIKATIFKRPEFIERTRLVIPVYIDGDSANAQLYADRFGVVGYPTMLVLRPDGTEITRLPGGVDLDLYTSLLDSAISNLKPVKDLIAAAERDPKSLQPADWHLLAYYAWEVDAGRVVDPKETPALLQKLLARCQPVGPALDCMRLELTLAAQVARMEEKERLPIDRVHLLATLRDLLGSSALQRRNIDDLIYYSGDLVSAATRAGSEERSQLVQEWQSTLDNLANDESLTRVDRVGMAYGRVLLARADTPKGPLPADVQAIARDRAAWGDQVTTDPYERQAVINRAAAALDEADLKQEANDLLTRELKVSKSPYYFMLDIADLAEQAGHKDEALHWLERAYNESQGPATRFQWGTNYLLGLLEMAPDDDIRIQRIGLAVIDELGKDRNSIHQRSRIRLENIDRALRGWNKGDNHRPVVRAIRARLQEICAPIDNMDSARKSCDAFLDHA